MSLTASSITSNYSNFAQGYDDNAIGAYLNIVPFNYTTAVTQESGGLNTQVQRLQSATNQKQSFMSMAASSSTQKPAFALAELQKKGFSVASPQVAGVVFNAVKDRHYGVQSAQAMSAPPKVLSGYAPPNHYTSVYKGREGGVGGNVAPASGGGVVAPKTEAYANMKMAAKERKLPVRGGREK